MTIPNLYGIENKKRYRAGVDKESEPPHIFAVADNAFEALKKDQKNQVRGPISFFLQHAPPPLFSPPPPSTILRQPS